MPSLSSSPLPHTPPQSIPHLEFLLSFIFLHLCFDPNLKNIMLGFIFFFKFIISIYYIIHLWLSYFQSIWFLGYINTDMFTSSSLSSRVYNIANILFFFTSVNSNLGCLSCFRVRNNDLRNIFIHVSWWLHTRARSIISRSRIYVYPTWYDKQALHFYQ